MLNYDSWGSNTTYFVAHNEQCWWDKLYDGKVVHVGHNRVAKKLEGGTVTGPNNS